MIIDKTIFAAIDEGVLTPEQVCATLLQAWDAIEQSALEQAAAQAIADGFNVADVKLVTEQHARALRADRARRLEGARLAIERELARELVH